MKSKIAAVVVLYNPSLDFINNIYSYIDHVSLLVIVDNSEKSNSSLLETLSLNQKVKLISNNENTGIAKAINSGILIASSYNFDWALTMDQDSYFEKEMINNYITAFDELANKEKVALIGPITEKKENNKNQEEIKNVTSLITSGSLININLFNEIGGYNEKLFIDEVDHEYCYRALIAGYTILQFQNILLGHTLGKKVAVKTILGEKKVKTFHSPIRLYYIVRNCSYIIATYKKVFPEEIKFRRKDLLVRIKNNLLYGTKKFASLRYIILGFIHYKINRFGKL